MSVIAESVGLVVGDGPSEKECWSEIGAEKNEAEENCLPLKSNPISQPRPNSHWFAHSSSSHALVSKCA